MFIAQRVGKSDDATTTTASKGDPARGNLSGIADTSRKDTTGRPEPTKEDKPTPVKKDEKPTPITKKDDKPEPVTKDEKPTSVTKVDKGEPEKPDPKLALRGPIHGPPAIQPLVWRPSPIVGGEVRGSGIYAFKPASKRMRPRKGGTVTLGLLAKDLDSFNPLLWQNVETYHVLYLLYPHLMYEQPDPERGMPTFTPGIRRAVGDRAWESDHSILAARMRLERRHADHGPRHPLLVGSWS